MKQLIYAAFLSLAASAANAQWLHQETGGAFDNNKTQLALTSSGNYAFGLRCTDTSDLTAIFITPEQAEANSVELLNASKPKILVRIDDKDIETIPAQVDISKQGLSFFGDSPETVAKELIDGKSRVSVAVKILGTLYHETEFRVNGSTKAVKQMLQGCGFKEE